MTARRWAGGVLMAATGLLLSSCATAPGAINPGGSDEANRIVLAEPASPSWDCPGTATPAPLTGTVTAPGGAPLAGVAVELTQPREPGQEGDAAGGAALGATMGVTDSHGHFELRGGCSGSGQLEIGRDADWRVGQQRDITLVPGANRADVVLHEAARIEVEVANGDAWHWPALTFTDTATGQVLRDSDEAGSPAVSVVDEGDGASSRRQVFQLPAGTYAVRAGDPVTGTLTFRGERTHTVVAKAGQVTRATFAISPGGTISGKLTPVPGKDRCYDFGRVTFKSSSGFTWWAPIAADGSFVAGHLEPGTYQAHVVYFTGGRQLGQFLRTADGATRFDAREGATTKLAEVTLSGKTEGEPYYPLDLMMGGACDA